VSPLFIRGGRGKGPLKKWRVRGGVGISSAYFLKPSA